MKDYLAQFGGLKHIIAVAYAAAFALFQTNTDFRSYALSVYGAFPHWLSAMTIGLVVPVIAFYNQSIKAGAAKTAMILACLGLALAPTLGCTPPDTAKAVQKIEAYLPTAKVLATEGITIASQFDNELDQQHALALQNEISQDIDKLQQIGNVYLQSPSASNWQSIVTLLDALVATADQQLLAATHIKDPASQAKVTAVLGALDLAVHALDSFVQAAQPASAVQATAAARATKLSQLEPYWPRDQVTPEMAGVIRVGERLGF